MHGVLTASEARTLDEATIASGFPGLALMEMAGAACARSAIAHFAGRLASRGAVVIAGRGNNGGDGWVVARTLRARGYSVQVRCVGDPAQVRGDARWNLDRLGPADLEVLAGASDLRGLEGLVRATGLVVDALFGSGLSGPVTGLPADVIDVLNGTGTPILAVDIPSGVDATTGAAAGAAVQARVTVTFGALKWGHLLHPGAARAGLLEVADIGFDPVWTARMASGRLLLPSSLPRRLPPRPRGVHKGNLGHVLLVAGSRQMPGAAVLAATGALRAGAGLVTLAIPEGITGLLPPLPPELMLAELPCRGGALAAEALPALQELAAHRQVVALGPGLGRSEDAGRVVRALAGDLPVPMVLDADALNALSGDAALLARAPATRVLTPHPGEAGRLLGRPLDQVVADRPRAVRDLAALGGRVTAVLKGAGTLVATGSEPPSVVAAGNPGLASGGSGDVLTGVLAALLARGMSGPDSAEAAALWHAVAGDRAAAARGEEGLLASDVAAGLGTALEAVRRGDVPDPYPWR